MTSLADIQALLPPDHTGDVEDPRLTIRDLVALHDAFTAASDAILSVLNMPRGQAAAADLLELEIERLDRLRDSAVAKLRLRAPTTPDEADERLRLLVSWEASLGEWQEAASLLATAAVRQGRLPPGDEAPARAT